MWKSYSTIYEKFLPFNSLRAKKKFFPFPIHSSPPSSLRLFLPTFPLSLSLSTFHSTFIFSFDLHVLQSDEKDDSEDNNIILDTYSLLTHTHFTFHILLTLFAFFVTSHSLSLSLPEFLSPLSLSSRISFPSIITQVFIIILFS